MTRALDAIRDGVTTLEHYRLPHDPVGITDIRRAAERLAGRVVRTPVLSSPMLDELAGAKILIKSGPGAPGWWRSPREPRPGGRGQDGRLSRSESREWPRTPY